MTSFPMQIATTPVLSPLLSKEKGTMGNRLDCSVDQTKNFIATTAKVGVGAGVVGGAVWAMNKYGNKKAVESIIKGGGSVVDASLNGLKKLFKGPKVKEFADKLISLSSKNKTAGALALIALPIITYVGAKGFYKMGQIDQQYTDKAHTQDILRS